MTRLMSPGDLGGLVKPFVFLDYFEFRGFKSDGGPVHPHSGIATHTTLLQGSLVYGDSTGKFVEWVMPATAAFPKLSSFRPEIESSRIPPR